MIHGALYKCSRCGAEFERPKVITGYNMSFPRDYDVPDEYVCPECDSDEYEKADRCAECGDVFLEKELDWGLCNKCLEFEAGYRAAEYVMRDSEARDAFAFWLHFNRKHGEEHE